MLGPSKPRRLDEPIAVSLDELIPPDHFYRHLEVLLDLGFVRDWVRERYTERGRPSRTCHWSHYRGYSSIGCCLRR